MDDRRCLAFRGRDSGGIPRTTQAGAGQRMGSVAERIASVGGTMDTTLLPTGVDSVQAWVPLERPAPLRPADRRRKTGPPRETRSALCGPRPVVRAPSDTLKLNEIHPLEDAHAPLNVECRPPGPWRSASPQSPSPPPPRQPPARTPARYRPRLLVGGAFADCSGTTAPVEQGPLYNIAYPQRRAPVLGGLHHRPAGSKISLTDDYRTSRYFSFPSRTNRVGQPINEITDYQIPADSGPTNPFRPSRADARTAAPLHDRPRARQEPRDGGSLTTPAVPLYTIRDPRDNEPQRNDLRMVATGPALGYRACRWEEKSEDDDLAYDTELMLMRVYVPDRGMDITSGVGLPQPTSHSPTARSSRAKRRATPPTRSRRTLGEDHRQPR